MLSYLHAFHAGNHADVLKHVVLLALVRYLQRKETGCRFVDTHAGSGGYVVDAPALRGRGEAAGGIGVLWPGDAASQPAALADYLELVGRFNPDGALRHYPGSPQLLQALLRPQDQLRLYELHPREFERLHARMDGDRRVRAEHADGLAALRAVLPPPTRRGLVLIDPPYEDRDEYAQVLRALTEARTRFATGVCAVWYPRISRPESRRLPELLRETAGRDWLHAWLDVDGPQDEGPGLHGSGVFIVNPPWTLPASLEPVLPTLAARLARDGAGRWGIEHDIR